MKVNLMIPDLSALSSTSISFAIRRTFHSVGPKRYDQYALIMNFFRLVDLASTEYQHGREQISQFWSTQDSLELGAAIRASGYFEACICNVKRAVNYLKIIRSWKDLPMEVKRLLPRRLKVTTSNVEKQVSEMRNVIQHLEESIDSGKIPEGQSICLMPEQDRLVLGESYILYSDLAEWIKELHDCASKISSFYAENSSDSPATVG